MIASSAVSGAPGRYQRVALSVGRRMTSGPGAPLRLVTMSSHSAVRKSAGRAVKSIPPPRSTACTHTSRERSHGISVAATVRPCAVSTRDAHWLSSNPNHDASYFSWSPNERWGSWTTNLEVSDYGTYHVWKS